MLKVALLHILLRNFFSAQTLPHGVLEHKPRNSRSCNFSCRANNLFTSSVNRTKINLSGEGRLPPLALCWSISTDLGKADEHSVRCVLTERDNAGCRVKNCFLPCFLHTPSSPWNILLPELKFRRNFCSQDLTHWVSLASEHSTTSKEQEHLQNNKLLAQPGPNYSSCAWQGPPAAFRLLTSTGSRDHTTMWQLISFVADQFLMCFSTEAPFHHDGAGRDLQLRAGIPFLGRILHFRVSLMQLTLQFIFIDQLLYLKSVSTVCKSGGRARSWSCLYNPSTLLPYCHIFLPQELISYHWSFCHGSSSLLSLILCSSVWKITG